MSSIIKPIKSRLTNSSLSLSFYHSGVRNRKPSKVCGFAIYIMEREGFNLSTAMIRHYDINGDGVVDAVDYVKLQNLIGISMN